MLMRRLAPALALFAAACATTPPQQQQPETPAVITPSPHVRSQLLGLSTSQLVSELGTPQLQVREGTSLKLQFRSTSCVLDAYLYPENGSGQLKVTHIDTRTPAGADSSQAACISELQRTS
jgi:hypothetical protein